MDPCFRNRGKKMNTIVAISGSPSPVSRTEKVLGFLSDQLTDRGLSVKKIFARQVDADILVRADDKARQIKEISKTLSRADGILVVSPVYKMAYTGLLKVFFDLLPRDIFLGKPVLPVMIGGTDKHFMVLDLMLKPLLAFMKGETLQGIYLLDRQVAHGASDHPPLHDKDILRRIGTQLDLLIENAVYKTSSGDGTTPH
ncbi:FMN reductase (NADPH) [Sporolactobacillus sp. THM7-7]|nr:FMN reductase (NADPH) [Sporolactobacillus sp. THM7-7]